MTKIAIIVALIFIVLLIVASIFTEANIFALGGVEVVIYFTIISAWAHFRHKKESFTQPYTLSNNDAGKIVRVVEIYDDKILLVSWGFVSYGIGDKDEPETWYHINEVPKMLREINCIFKIEQNLVFKKVIKYGYKNKSLPPFKVINEPCY